MGSAHQERPPPLWCSSVRPVCVLASNLPSCVDGNRQTVIRSITPAFSGEHSFEIHTPDIKMLTHVGYLCGIRFRRFFRNDSPCAALSLAMIHGSATGVPTVSCCVPTRPWKCGTAKISATKAISSAGGTVKTLLCSSIQSIKCWRAAYRSSSFSTSATEVHRPSVTAALK
jgi:hypothetical protein